MFSRYSRTKWQVKVGKTKVAIKATSQAIIRPTDRASVVRKGSGGLEVADPRWGLISGRYLPIPILFMKLKMT